MRNLRTTGAALSLIAALCACGGPAAKEGAPTPVTPSKESVVARLRSFEAAARAGDLEGALTHLVPFGGVTSAAIAKLVEVEGITSAAIDLLAAQATFGPLAEIYPERGAAFAKKAGVDLAQCYALRADPAEVAAHFDGTRLRFIRIDDLHKLKP
jgi:hypothetical protein